MTEVLIVGGGLGGLSLAKQLATRGVDYLVVEARERLGGRILSRPAKSSGATVNPYDLGAAWFWPGQTRMARLIADLGLEVFEQHASGMLVYQDKDGSVRRELCFATMQGSLRVAGGMTQLVNGLAAQLPASRLMTGHALINLAFTDRRIGARVRHHSAETVIEAQRVVLAIPPRVAAETIQFDPDLGVPVREAMKRTPTWMAGHAKVVAVYDRSFWHETGLSGDGISHGGPLVEIHDASPNSGDEGALFGFVSIPARYRRSTSFDISGASIAQLTAMFGHQASSPIDVIFYDWATEKYTATDEDVDEAPQHPNYGGLPELTGNWNGRLLFASTEAASSFGGFLEGAIEASEHAASSCARDQKPAQFRE